SFAILTAIGNQHVALFGSVQNLVETKRELLESLPKTGTAFVNKDTGYLEKLQKGVRGQIVLFSQNDHDPLLDDKVRKNVFVSNLIPCIKLARLFGMNDTAIKKGIDKIINESVSHSPTKGYRGCFIIDNSYNTNLKSFLFAIDTLSKYEYQNKIIVSRGIIELGDQKTDSYTEITNKLSDAGVVLYTTDNDFMEKQNNVVRYFAAESPLFEALKKIAGNTTVIVFEGKFSPQYILKMKTYDIN
ncbi:hypothetical protein COY90_00035, partial [Candidatus Roizmanbacteria bacterium CG_4_10_14_0_8_um_filter_39_9]